MKNEEKKSILAKIASLKKELLILRVKISMGETIAAKEYKNKKKEIARLFTIINAPAN